MLLSTIVTLVVTILTFLVICGLSAKFGLRAFGRRMQRSSRRKRKFLLRMLESEVAQPMIIGFFHPYCNAGGGGERVLWAAIRSTLQEYPNVFCIVYTGDLESSKDVIIERAKVAFGISLDSRRIDIIHLRKRYLVAAETWPHFTLIGQSLGSVPLAFEAVSRLVPDIFIDTMGYAFTYPLIYYLLRIPIATYTHYPTISTDMLANPSIPKIKLQYWKSFAWLYSLVGQYADLVMANSSWTMRHLEHLWKLAPSKTKIVYPPCDTKTLIDIPISDNRSQDIVCVAQFRPEKDHPTLLRAYERLVNCLRPDLRSTTKMILIGTVRNELDRRRVRELQQLAQELSIDANIVLLEDVPWPRVTEILSSSYIGTNAMWNEHFGIGVVEYMAAGLIPVVHDSAGPKLDIVVPYDGQKTGLHASSVDTFADAFNAAFSLAPDSCRKMRLRARESSKRFSEEVFDKNWKSAISVLMKLEKKRKTIERG